MLKFSIRIISLILASALLFINVYSSSALNLTTTLIVVLCSMFISFFIYKYRRPDNKDFDINLLIVLGVTLLVQSVFYLVGFKTGQTNNLSSMFKGYIPQIKIWTVFLIVIGREVMRYLIVDDDTEKKYKYYIINTLFVIFSVLVDLCIATKVYLLTSFTLVYEFIALFLIPSIAKNILLSYLSKKNGYKLSLIYVLMMDLYIYFIPVLPKINMLLQAVTLLVLPYALYVLMGSFEVRYKNKERKKKKESTIVKTINNIIFIILVVLVSREFSYCMIGIGSGSMTGTINKGDAIIYYKYDTKETTLQSGDIIVFEKDSRMIVHRIIKKFVVNGKNVYKTKGDNNEKEDNWIVPDDTVLGIVKVRIPYIAWPSVWLGEIF